MQPQHQQGIHPPQHPQEPGGSPLSDGVRHPSRRRLLAAAGCIACGTLSLSLFLQSILSSNAVAGGFMSRLLWQRIVTWMGGRVHTSDGQELTASIDFLAIAIPLFVLAALLWFGGALWIGLSRQVSLSGALASWGMYGWAWWLVAGAWELAVALAAAELDDLAAFLSGTANLAMALVIGGWLATLCTLSTDGSDVSTSPIRDDFRVPLGVWFVAGCYAAVFVIMNWQLYRGLLVPHGDSAMYEEHLWNLTHGKGFRSYLDQGLFLGEHIQFVHVFLLPLYLFWPSHLLLELCETLALASGAIPVYWMARRHAASRHVGFLLAAAYLLYFPMQFLDISIDLKTFRPIAFGVPLLLFALDQMERGRYCTMIVLLLLTLTAKEDYAIVIAPLGLWMLFRQSRFMLQPRPEPQTNVELTEQPPAAVGTATPFSQATRRRTWLFGCGLALFGVVYLLAATRVVIPWFRGGEEVHYARYFSDLGGSLEEIVWNILTKPELLFHKLATPQTLIYTLYILLPIGFVPLLSPGRLAVGLPLFGLLCLNQIAQDPRHHFHAPLVPIVFWAAAAAVGVAARRLRRESIEWWPNFAWSCALATGLFVSLHPLGVTFWDPGSLYHWRNLYVPGRRAQLFENVYRIIPTDARVASTDFVHPRFTHHERSYDYSKYPRAVSNYELRVPDDTDYIVIDTRHYYSEIKSPHQVREYREEPDRWELLPDTTSGHFIVLRRREE